METDSCFFSTFTRHDDPDDATRIGTYVFSVLDYEGFGLTGVPIYRMTVRRLYGRNSFDYDAGDAPSVRAGRALDLHQAVMARLRLDARERDGSTWFYIDDAGKVAEGDASAFWDDRAPVVERELGAALLGGLAGELVQLATEGRSPLSRPPSPPAPSL